MTRTQGSVPLTLTTAPIRAHQARPAGSCVPAAAPALAPHPAAPGHQPFAGPSGMGGWPQEGRQAPEDPSPQHAGQGRSFETRSAFPCVAHDLVRGLKVVSRGSCGQVLEGSEAC